MFLTLGLLLVGTLLALNERRLGRRALAAALAEGGGPWSLAAAVPPTVPEDDNAWLLLATLTNQLISPPAVRAPSLGAGYTAPGLMRSWQAPLDWTNEAGDRAGWPGLRAELEQHGPDWDVLRAALQRPDYHFPFAYTNGFFDLPQDISPLLQASRWLLAAGALAVHDGRTEDALSHAEALLRLARHQRRQNLLIGQMARSATLTHGLTLTAHLVFEGAATEEQLSRLQAAWNQVEPLSALGPTLRLERVIAEQHQRIVLTNQARQLEALEWLEESREIMDEPATAKALLWLKRYLQLPLWRLMWTDHDAARAVRRWNRLIEASDAALVASWTDGAYALYACDVANGSLEVEGYAEVPRPGWLDKLRCLYSTGGASLAPDSSYVERFFRMEVMRNLSIAAIASARFRLATGEWPDDLEATIPRFLPAVPRDPMDGKTLRLRPTRQGPVIYSVGRDGENQGGNPRGDDEDGPGLAWFSGRDWVFPRIGPPE